MSKTTNIHPIRKLRPPPDQSTALIHARSFVAEAADSVRLAIAHLGKNASNVRKDLGRALTILKGAERTIKQLRGTKRG